MCRIFVLDCVSQMLNLCLSQSAFFHRIGLENLCFKIHIFIKYTNHSNYSFISPSPENDLLISVPTPSSSFFRETFLLKLCKRSDKYYHKHYVKSVRIRSFFWSVFSCNQTGKNSVFGHFSRSETSLNITLW